MHFTGQVDYLEKGKMKKLTTLLIALGLLVTIPAFAQEDDYPPTGDGSHTDSIYSLLMDIDIQIDATQAINDMYNFKFGVAEQKFRWMAVRYNWHPLPEFLLALSSWWKIVPNIDNEEYDDEFNERIDKAIDKGHVFFDKYPDNAEAAFMLSAAYAFRGRLEGERGQYRKATFSGQRSLKYFRICQGNEYFSPELLFGDGLYNYYSVYIKENYPLLRPLLIFMKTGDKELGIKQLREVSSNAFYTRTEAQYFLMRILADERKDMRGALQLAEYLHETFPDNAYFHRYYARMLYSTGDYTRAMPVAEDVLTKLDSGMMGYEATSGRYAAFFLGQIYQARGDTGQAKKYYQRSVELSESIDAEDAGYYHWSLYNLARIAKEEGDDKAAKELVKEVKKHAKRKSRVHEEARELY